MCVRLGIPQRFLRDQWYSTEIDVYATEIVVCISLNVFIFGTSCFENVFDTKTKLFSSKLNRR